MLPTEQTMLKAHLNNNLDKENITLFIPNNHLLFLKEI
jgi:hypothetical protein